MAKSATAWLDSLTPEQRQKAAMPLDSTDRTHWNFIPMNHVPAQGLPIKEMTEPQRKLAHELLKSALSQRGYTVTTTIMSELEAILRDTEAPRERAPAARRPAVGAAPPGRRWNPRSGAVFLLGVRHAGEKGAGAWRVEGHHVSLHFTIADGRAVVAAPTFFGSNPAEVREGPKKGLRALDREQDAGRAW